MKDIIKSILFLFVLLNPFLIVVYLTDIVKNKPLRIFGNILLRAGLISFVVFSLFAILGDAVFTTFLNANFASFQIFGGVIFLLIGIQFIFKGGVAIEILRGESKHIAGAIAMPILIGPGTLTYSVIIGQRLSKVNAVIAIGLTVFLCISIIYLLKLLYDRIHRKKEELIEQYIDIAGRVTAFIIGTISIEMIMNGIIFWIHRIQ
jgi:small neutral amino acid transporter SnatA (MarC family)